ncbi:helix-turn-helix domain-containing protein [Halosegnis sp.]|uniref:helix-turn-helix domain-containing protein n=1 Tax=Halosegnis sp. TaxID=2864959 RepID=UPI0035D3E2B0
MADDSLRPADRRILSYLAEHPPEYVPLIATRLGLPLGHADGRVEALAERGYVQPVTNECIYGLTPAGEQRLDEVDVEADRADRERVEE